MYLYHLSSIDFGEISWITEHEENPDTNQASVTHTWVEFFWICAILDLSSPCETEAVNKSEQEQELKRVQYES